MCTAQKGKLPSNSFGHSIVCGKRFVFIIFCLLLLFLNRQNKDYKKKEGTICLLCLLFKKVTFKTSSLVPVQANTRNHRHKHPVWVSLICFILDQQGHFGFLQQGQMHRAMLLGKASRSKSLVQRFWPPLKTL